MMTEDILFEKSPKYCNTSKLRLIDTEDVPGAHCCTMTTEATGPSSCSLRLSPA
jgi:hypothetical protein